jgi:hypothetical protein
MIIDNIKYELTQIELVNPVHLTMVKNGGGEFPDTYSLTEADVKKIMAHLEAVSK